MGIYGGTTLMYCRPHNSTCTSACTQKYDQLEFDGIIYDYAIKLELDGRMEENIDPTRVAEIFDITDEKVAKISIKGFGWSYFTDMTCTLSSPPSTTKIPMKELVLPDNFLGMVIDYKKNKNREQRVVSIENCYGINNLEDIKKARKLLEELEGHYNDGHCN